MTIQTTDLQWLKAALQSRTIPAQNGGRMTEEEIASAVKNNLFADVSQAERQAGVTHRTKAFIANRNAANLPLIAPKISIEQGTPGDTHVLLYAGTQTDTEDALAGRPYGYGTLAADVLAGSTTITLTTEADWSGLDAADAPFQVGDVVRVDARATVLDAGDYEYRTVASVSYAGTTLTLGIDALDYSYTAADGVHVASVMEPADIATGYADTGAVGTTTYDWAAHLALAHIGTLHQVWTLTVEDAGTGLVRVEGDTVGDLGGFASGVEIAPINPAGGVYFRLAAAGWGGTMVNGDTLTFTTLPAATPVWYERVVPLGAASISADPVSVCIEGESS